LLPIGQITSDFVTKFGVQPAPWSGPRLTGEYAVVTIMARSGRIAVNEDPGFDDPAQPIIGLYPVPPPPAPPPVIRYNASLPFIRAQQGMTDR
jgi:hypothetical protein